MSQSIQDWALKVSSTPQDVDAAKNNNAQSPLPISSDVNPDDYSYNWNYDWDSEDSRDDEDDEDVTGHSRRCVLDSRACAYKEYTPYDVSPIGSPHS